MNFAYDQNRIIDRDSDFQLASDISQKITNERILDIEGRYENDNENELTYNNSNNINSYRKSSGTNYRDYSNYPRGIIPSREDNDFPYFGLDNTSLPNLHRDEEESSTRGTGIFSKKRLNQGSRLMGLRGIPGCSSCGGSGYKSSTDKYGIHKSCSSCANLYSKYLPRLRGIEGCKYCSGDGFVKSGSDSVKPCNHCLRISGYCRSCLDTGYRLLVGTTCDHRR